MSIAEDKGGGHWPRNLVRGGGNLNKSPPHREKDFSSEEKSPLPHGEIPYNSLGG